MAVDRKKSRRSRSKKKSIIPPKYIVGGVFFVFVFLITAIIINGRVTNLKKQLSEDVKKDRSLIYQVDESIKIILFDHEISKEHFQKNSSDGKITYLIEAPDEDTYSIETSVAGALKRIGFVQENGYFKNSSNGTLLEIKVVPIPPVIKKTEDVKNTQLPVFPEQNHKKKIAIILDDAGNSLKLAEDILKLPFNITLSVIPFTPFDRETADMVRRYKKELFLHLPMQPKSYPDTDPGKGAILLNTPESLVDIIIKKDVERLGKIDGTNNHMGSALTENAIKIQQVFSYVKKYTDTFVDSHTAKNSVAYELCKKYMDYCGVNRVFIDNMNDYDYIKSRIDDGLGILKNEDRLIMIGHLKPVTVEVIKKYIPELLKNKIEFTTVKEVLSN